MDDEDDDVATEDGDLWYSDADGDGYGDASSTVLACEQPSDAVDNDEDCDDSNDTVHPDAEETCDGIDNDCDDLVDDDDNGVTGTTTYYGDSDADGYGGSTFSEELCEQPSGYVDNNDDCDDLDDQINPVAVEVCDEIDNDCDDLVDDEDDDVAGSDTWYQDSDGDGETNGEELGDPCCLWAAYDVPSEYPSER